ncbi:ComEA family DNA-binding protein [Bacteroidota bacterium]
MLPTWIKEYLSFHKKERRGILILLVLIVLLLGFNVYQRVFWKADWEESILKYGSEITLFTERMDTIQEMTSDKKPWVPASAQLFDFDPNTLDKEGWIKLGFSHKQAASILKYRQSGAVFRKPEDLLKLYVIDDLKFEQLKSYINIKSVSAEVSKDRREEVASNSKPERAQADKKSVLIELNTADSASLVQVKGIGPFFARVIIEYRNKLGGYRAKEQVLEVYGMDSAKYARIENQIYVDAAKRGNININEVTLKELVRHPYINFNQAKALVNYRQQHGAFKAVSELRDIHLIKEEDYGRIAPYCSVK